MRPTILLAVDSAEHAAPAVAYVKELAAATGDEVVVLHVHEIAVGRWGRARVDCPDDQGDEWIEQVAADLSKAGVKARAEVGETMFGHVTGEILAAADRFDVRMLAVCSRGRGDLASLALGSVAHGLVHLSRRPVLVVPQHMPVELPRQAATGVAQA